MKTSECVRACQHAVRASCMVSVTLKGFFGPRHDSTNNKGGSPADGRPRPKSEMTTRLVISTMYLVTLPGAPGGNSSIKHTVASFHQTLAGYY